MVLNAGHLQFEDDYHKGLTINFNDKDELLVAIITTKNGTIKLPDILEPLSCRECY